VFLSCWEKELPAMRNVISRIPEGSDYRPDPKSRTAREIAWLIVREQQALVEGFESGVMEWAEVPAPATVKEVVDAFDALNRDSVARLRSTDAQRWEEPMAFTFQGTEVMRSPGHEMAWGFLLDLVHHRGQLSTYLRPMGAKVPQIYGPSADEPM
jgi:uncharacterized damage-inducible protein DinB